MAIGLGTTLSSSAILLGTGFSSHCQSCHAEELCCSISSGVVCGWIRIPYESNRRACYDHSGISFKCRNPFSGAVPSRLLPTGQEISLSKVWVAADYSDSVPDASNYMGSLGYHPLEEVKDRGRRRDVMLTDAEIARSTVEANNQGVMVFPGAVHREPYGHASWGEFQYVIDDYGDIFFEIYNDENILQDRGASNPVTVLIGLDIPMHGENKRIVGNYNNDLDIGSSDDIISDDEEIDYMEEPETLIDWGMPATARYVHPMYFAKLLTKAVHAQYGERMDCPSNGVSISGILRPAFFDEESYLRRLFHGDDSDGYVSDWKDESEKEEEQMAATYDLAEAEFMKFNSKESSSLYKLEILSIDLFSVYGVQSVISLQDFQEAEPDALVHSASAIIDHFNNVYGMKCAAALKSLSRKKKGLNVEGANLIGVDSLGVDVRVFSGIEAQTLRFPFSSRATSESSAEKKIRRMLFPRYHRKNFKNCIDGHRDSDSL